MHYILKNIPAKQLTEGISGRYLHTQNSTMGLINVDKGAVLPEHAHIHEQITHMISGKLEMVINGKIQLLETGMVTVIPSNVLHSARALTDCVIVDTFFPVREDYK